MKKSKIRQLIVYDSNTGETHWRERPVGEFRTPGLGHQWNKRFAHRSAGSDILVNDALYRRLTIGGETYSMAKLVWLYVTGEYPRQRVIHLDGDKLNMAWDNLYCPVFI